MLLLLGLSLELLRVLTLGREPGFRFSVKKVLKIEKGLHKSIRSEE